MNIEDEMGQKVMKILRICSSYLDDLKAKSISLFHDSLKNIHYKNIQISVYFHFHN